MNQYIKSLKNQDKLKIAIDKNIDFKWSYKKIAGPCSVEGPNIVEIAKNIKNCGATYLELVHINHVLFLWNRKWMERAKERGLQLLKEAKAESDYQYY